MSIEQEMKAENARLKAEVERLTKRNKFLEQIDSYLQDANQHSFEQRCNELEAEVERLKSVITIEQRTIQGLQQTPEWSDIARLTAECRRLEAENNRLRAASFVTAVPVEQYERLLKAGDAMAGNLDRFLNESIADCNWLRDGLSNWNAAKEGKPTK